ncbi:hypothetical protein EGW08_010106 [Elysia chlorotica]|uniref:N-acetylphosphatidylethanolamine-hydrolyzing phospholipase D n=1 Tax=Elysia chlorotica TaxID=188477 RepID=A0A3S1BEF7_ELYCH|nr:hypothetical protein EGW08_010106 [Elysia chlorotica]
METMEEDEQLELELDASNDMDVDDSEDFSASPSPSSQPSPLGAEHNPEDVKTMPIYENGRYRNPWKTWQRPKLTNLFKLLFCTTKDKSGIPGKAELDATLPVLEPDISMFDKSPPSGIRHLWIGHSTSLIQFDGVTILTDPVFSDRCSPIKFVGNKRFRSTPCTIDALPKVDLVLISNANYDHLDYASVIALKERYGDELQWYVPMGLKKWMNGCGCNNVVEMTWWQTDVFYDDLNIVVACTPCQHWAKRTAKDENKVLWCSWCVIGPLHSFHFTGDTAYCEGFKQIGRRFGPFTLSTIPIGAYSPRDIMGSMHSDPEQAVTIHEDLRSQASIGVHWGTFSLAYEPYLEPRELLEAEVEKRRMKPNSFFTVSHGEITLVGADGYNDID